MKLTSLVMALSLLGCATTGGKVSAGVAGLAFGGAIVQEGRLLSCDEDGSSACADRVRNTGIVLLAVAAAAVIAAVVFESHAPPSGD
jgi:hypothetical protein